MHKSSITINVHKITINRYCTVIVSSAESHLRSINNVNINNNHPHFHHLTNKCKETQFRCLSDGACIEGFKRCNDIRDCSDSSDEFDCPGGIFDYAGKNSHISLFIHIYPFLKIYQSQCLELKYSVIGPIKYI